MAAEQTPRMRFRGAEFPRSRISATTAGVLLESPRGSLSLDTTWPLNR
jgi:hypothetical protein